MHEHSTLIHMQNKALKKFKDVMAIEKVRPTVELENVHVYV